MHPPSTLEVGSQIIPLMATLMLVVQLLLIAQRMLLTSIRLFAIQSLLLAGIAAVVAYYYNAGHVYVVAVLTLVGKVIFLPWLLTRLVHRIQIHQDTEPLLNAPTSMLICAALARDKAARREARMGSKSLRLFGASKPDFVGTTSAIGSGQDHRQPRQADKENEGSTGRFESGTYMT